MISLTHISILLLEPQSPANIGSVARAMKNMGLTSLYLIKPRTEINAESFQLACGADDILLAARRTETLEETLQSFTLCVGTTSRFVDTFPRVLTPHQLATQIAEYSSECQIALLFGPERTGLTNVQVQYCQWLVTIPSNPAFESMNLSHAVAILAYELYSHQPRPALGREIRKARLSQIESFCQTLERNLIEIGFLKGPYPERLMITIRNVLSRASLEDRDVQILRGILRQWNWYAEKLRRPTSREKVK